MSSPEEGGPDLVASWQPMGTALLEYAGSPGDATILVSSDLWYDEEMAVADYYRPDHLPLSELEQAALARCHGRVLDVGAGAGRFSLELAAKGFEVQALDASPEAVEVMRRRGVRNVRRGDVFQLRDERWDTLLMMMHGIGIVGTLENMDRFLEHATSLLRPGGQILCDSADLRSGLDPDDLAAIEEELENGSYLGEVVFQLSYRGVQGEPYPWLFVDPETLAERAGRAGYHFERLADGERGAYLARLSR